MTEEEQKEWKEYVSYCLKNEGGVNYFSGEAKKRELMKKYRPEEYGKYLKRMQRWSDALLNKPKEPRDSGRSYGLLFE